MVRLGTYAKAGDEDRQLPLFFVLRAHCSDLRIDRLVRCLGSFDSRAGQQGMRADGCRESWF